MSATEVCPTCGRSDDGVSRAFRDFLDGPPPEDCPDPWHDRAALSPEPEGSEG